MLSTIVQEPNDEATLTFALNSPNLPSLLFLNQHLNTLWVLFDRTQNKVEDDKTVISQISCGPTDTAVVLSDGRCFVSGANKSGQLGLGHKRPVEEPTLLEGFSVSSFSMGQTSSAFIDQNGEMYSFGFGGSAMTGIGQLGHGDGEETLSPKLVVSIVEDNCHVKQVEVGESHMSVLTTEGEILATGAGSYGRLGNFETTDQLYLEPVELLTKGVDMIAGGKSFCLGLRDGIVYGWGRNHKGQLGLGYGLSVDMYSMEAVPTPLEGDELLGRRIVFIAAGHSHAACVSEKGELFFWGSAHHLEPERVVALGHTKVVDVVCGQDFTIARGEDGKLYSFGSGKAGTLGNAGSRVAPEATLIEALADQGAEQISAGWKHVGCLVDEA